MNDAQDRVAVLACNDDLGARWEIRRSHGARCRSRGVKRHPWPLRRCWRRRLRRGSGFGPRNACRLTPFDGHADIDLYACKCANELERFLERSKQLRELKENVAGIEAEVSSVKQGVAESRSENQANFDKLFKNYEL